MPFSSETDRMRNWKKIGMIATAVLVISFPVYLVRTALERQGDKHAQGPSFTGAASCIECHKNEYDLWKGSHHDLAMATATDSTVLGNFNDYEYRHRGRVHRFFRRGEKFFVNTEGPSGSFEDFEVAYTFGYTPLQQYLVPFEGGRLQCLPIAWDTERGRWFHLGDTIYTDEEVGPGNWLHWTSQAQNWNGMCADCHSTNLKKNYDPVTRSYNTTWSEIDVSCEACHGPASEHLVWAALPEDSRSADVNTGLIVRTRDLTNEELLNVCARCHSRRAIMGDYTDDNSDLLNYMIPMLTAQPLYHTDGQILDEVYEYGSFTQSRMFEQEVMCSDCHDSHSAKTIEPDNRLCLQCHRPDIYDTPRHHFHKMDPGIVTCQESIREAVENARIPGPGRQDGQENGNTGSSKSNRLINRGEPEYVEGTGAQCVNCHMTGRYYMGIDYRRDHSFRIPRPDLTARTGIPNACNDCHKDRSTAWSQSYILKWYGERTRPHYGETFAAAERGDSSVIPDLILCSGNELFPLMVRATAVRFLGQMNTPEANRAVERALTDPASLVRHTAVMSYNPTDVESYEKLLMPLLNDPVKGIRSEAGIRLSEVREDQLSPAARKARRAALDEYREINLYNADFPGGLFNLGIMYANAGNLAGAGAAYREALEVDDQFYMAKVNLATVYAQQGEHGEAERLLRELLREHPELHELNSSLAMLLAEQGRYGESREFFLKAAKLMPEQTRILYNLGLLENTMGNTSAAERYLLSALERAPGSYDYLYALTTFYLEHGKKDKALNYARQLADLFPGDPTTRQLVEAAGQ
ncbi:MAG: tetratricopeptide repeat protein [Bacteroidales bacterium]|nr:tetratricopeptide repeat protein [Bacteroidales bacterium]